jgi:hypothetical protein
MVGFLGLNVDLVLILGAAKVALNLKWLQLKGLALSHGRHQQIMVWLTLSTPDGDPGDCLQGAKKKPPPT